LRSNPMRQNSLSLENTPRCAEAKLAAELPAATRVSEILSLLAMLRHRNALGYSNSLDRVQ